MNEAVKYPGTQKEITTMLPRDVVYSKSRIFIYEGNPCTRATLSIPYR